MSISIIYTYFNQYDMLKKLINIWSSYPKELLDEFKFIIIDDCSKNKAKDYIPNNLPFVLELYEIETDIYCNIPGAMNLGSHVSDSEWLLHMDMDHYFEEKHLKNVLNLSKTGVNNKIYKFNRVYDKKTGKLKPHPKLSLMKRSTYWEIGGFDEDFCGSYGRTDTAFHTRAKLNSIATEEIQYNIFLEFDKQGEVIDLNRDLKRNTELLNNKIKNNTWSNKTLRFKWCRIL